MTTPSLEGLVPALYGYTRCTRCGTERAPGTLTDGRCHDWRRCGEPEWAREAPGSPASARTDTDSQSGPVLRYNDRGGPHSASEDAP